MNELKANINILFKLTIAVLILDMIISVLATLQLGIPHNNPLSWTSYQWHMMNFLWPPIIIDLLIFFLFITLCFLKKYFVFPLLLVCSICTLNAGIINVIEIINYGFIYPIDNLSGLIGILEFVLAFIGTIFWLNNLRNPFKPIIEQKIFQQTRL